MKAFPSSAASLVALLLIALTQPANAELYITIIEGLGGMPEYQENFSEQSHLVSLASNSMTNEENVTSFAGDTATRENVLAHFSELSEKMTDNDRAAIYLIGHGSFDGEEYKFNIPGPDINTTDLKNILDDFPGQNHFLLNTSSTSGAIIEPLENDSRILITATRNGNEKNATEFGAFFATALTSEAADLNKNNNISIQEAFDFAEREVADFFDSSDSLATEHPQIRGPGAAQFSLARVNLIELETEDPLINQLLAQRTAIDGKIEDLQLRRREFTNAEYIQQLQALILESATVSEQIDNLIQGAEGGSE